MTSSLNSRRNPSLNRHVSTIVSGPIDWGLSWLFSRLFAISPKVSKQGRQLVAKTSTKANILCLGAAGRSVVIDPDRKMIRIRRRTWWAAIQTRFIPFNAVQEIAYGYRDMDPGSGWSWSYQSNDLFDVGLKLRNGEQVLLFRFYGEGDFVNNGPFPDWFYWDEMIEAHITKTNTEGEARAFTDVISGLLGVPVGGWMP